MLEVVDQGWDCRVAVRVVGTCYRYRCFGWEPKRLDWGPLSKENTVRLMRSGSDQAKRSGGRVTGHVPFDL